MDFDVFMDSVVMTVNSRYNLFRKCSLSELFLRIKMRTSTEDRVGKMLVRGNRSN